MSPSTEPAADKWAVPLVPTATLRFTYLVAPVRARVSSVNALGATIYWVVKPELARMIEYSLDRSAFTPSSVVRTSSPDTDVGGSTSSNLSLHHAKTLSRSITGMSSFIIDNIIVSITWITYT